MITLSRDNILGNLYSRIAADNGHKVANICSSILFKAYYNVETVSLNQPSEEWIQKLEKDLNEYRCFEENDHGYTINPSFVLISDYYHYDYN